MAFPFHRELNPDLKYLPVLPIYSKSIKSYGGFSPSTMKPFLGGHRSWHQIAYNSKATEDFSKILFLNLLTSMILSFLKILLGLEFKLFKIWLKTFCPNFTKFLFHLMENWMLISNVYRFFIYSMSFNRLHVGPPSAFNAVAILLGMGSWCW